MTGLDEEDEYQQQRLEGMKHKHCYHTNTPLYKDHYKYVQQSTINDVMHLANFKAVSLALKILATALLESIC